jgi:hypothetical protein
MLMGYRTRVSAVALTVAIVLAIPFAWPPLAGGAPDPFAGTFAGDELTITLQGNGQTYQGQATYQGQTFPVQAQVTGNRMSGVYVAQGQRFPFEAMVQGDQMQLASGGRLYTLVRSGATPGPVGPLGRPPDASGAGSLAASPQDQQISRLLLSSAWCSFRYSQVSGTSSTQRVQFFPDGTVAQGSNTETYSSGRAGTVAGQHAGNQRGRWRVQAGALMLSEDGVSWSATPLQITQNSNGYPIVRADGKEYSQCR